MNRMNFADCPIVFIDQYYREKIGQIDLNCEKAILLSKDEKENSDLNTLRMKLINHIENLSNYVLCRYYQIESKFNQEMSETMIKEEKDEIFMDKYCYVLDVYRKFGLFEFKFGVLEYMHL